MTTLTDRYRRNLLIALHQREVPAERIGDILAEVDSHVADTGEDPTETFGTPKQYAATIATEGSHQKQPVWRRWLLPLVLGGSAGCW